MLFSRAVLFLLLVLLPGASAHSAGYGPTPLPIGRAAVIEMADNSFSPAVLRVRPGATITWRNTGRNPHTVTADDGSWTSGDIPPGGIFRRTFDRAGAVRYFCRPHGSRGGHGMAGVVLVGGADPLAPPAAPIRIRPPRTLRVPSSFPTIHAAVTASAPGDLILIAPGVYREEVVVTSGPLTLRGEDRNRVVLDGGFTLPNGIKVLGADGVVVENLTARHYTANGLYWTGARGYRASYVTAYNNGDYGVYAFDSVYGQFDHSYASGHPDSGFYIGQCKPCYAVITHVVAEHNALGYSGTNAGGTLTIMDSVWRRNIAGLVPNTLDSEALAPQDGTRIVNNLIYANHDEHAPVKALQYPTFGNGIVLAGGINNVVEGNCIWDHPNFGVIVIANVDRNLWIPSGHVVRANAIWASGRADIAMAAPAGRANCFEGNRFTRSRPPGLQHLYGCGSVLSRVGGGDPGALAILLRQYIRAQSGRFTSTDWRTQPVPPLQPGMPDPGAAPRPAWPTAESTTLPGTLRAAPPASPAEAAAFTATFPGPPSTSTEFARLLVYLLPFLVYDTSIVYVAWDGRRRRLPRLRRMAWTAGSLLLPYLGALLYIWRRRR